MSEMSLTQRVEMLSAHRSDEEARAARKDLECVGNAGITSVAELVEALQDPRKELPIRLTACSLLAWLGESSATHALERALEEAADDGLVWEVAKALIRLRSNASMPTLVRVLKQANPSKQSAAAYVLGWLAIADTVPDLIAAATDSTLDDQVRGHAIEALGTMRSDQAVPTLLSLLVNESPELRYWAAYSLGQIGDPASIPALEHMASHDVVVLGPPHNRSLQEEAMEALEAIREHQRQRTPD
jgi:HEAT repeat protein